MSVVTPSGDPGHAFYTCSVLQIMYSHANICTGLSLHGHAECCHFHKIQFCISILAFYSHANGGDQKRMRSTRRRTIVVSIGIMF